MLWPMASVSESNFGPLVAYLVPGATALAGLSPFSATLRNWFALAPAEVATIGGFLYLTIASLAAGMTISALRWVIVDTLHAHTDLPPPTFNFSRLGQNVAAFELLISIHYRHYQFYANMFVACAIAYAGFRAAVGTQIPLGWIDVAFIALEFVFFAASRDTLRKYYERGQQLLA